MRPSFHKGVRQRVRKMVRVIAEVVRQKHRQALTAATSISLAADSRGKYKVIRYRCDSASRPYVVDGVLAILMPYGDSYVLLMMLPVV